MKRLFQIFALVVALGSVAMWMALGMHRGWTKTEFQVKTLDPVTGIEGISYEKKLQPGVDLLGAGLVGAGCWPASPF